MPSVRVDSRLDLLRQLADPVRLGVLDRLVGKGPATASELAAQLDVSAPLLSNHLRRLREAGLLDVEAVGRQRIYRVTDSRVAPLLLLLADLDQGPQEPCTPPPFALARTCFDHLAGRLGVDLLDRLVELDAIHLDGDEVAPGPRAERVLGRLGVTSTGAAAGRRSVATACPDATEGRAHLGGAWGAALAAALVERDWTRPHDDRRDVEVTTVGRRGLRRVLQLDVSYLAGS